MKYVVDHSTDFEVLKTYPDRVILKSNYPCEYEESRLLPLYIYESPNSKKLLLFVHGLGTKNIKYLKWFPNEFSKNSYNAALMILPYHFERTPQGKRSGEMFLDTTDDRVLRARFEHAIVDILTSLNYLKSRYSPLSLYLMGFSFGGMVSVIASSFTNEISKLSLCVTGGNFYYITWRSFVTRVLRVQYEQNGQCSPQQCKLKHGKSFKNYINSLESPDLELDTAPSLCYEYDPLTYAKFVRVPTVMFRAIFDIFIPKPSTLELYNAIPTNQKRLYTIFSGHLTSYIFRRSILKKTIKFFERDT